MAQIVFDPVAFSSAYPQFAPATDGVFAGYFEQAGYLCDNSGAGIVTDPVELKDLLWLLVAHLATVFGYPGVKPAQITGRVSQATQGTTSVNTEAGPITMSNAWFMQTSYGFTFWARTAKYRTFQYAPPVGCCNGGTNAVWGW